MISVIYFYNGVIGNEREVDVDGDILKFRQGDFVERLGKRWHIFGIRKYPKTLPVEHIEVFLTGPL